MEIKQGLTLNDLIDLSKRDTKYKKLYTGLAMIDKNMQNFVKDIINDCISNSNEFYIKTEFMNRCYSIYLFNAIQQVTIGVSWPMADFLTMCAGKKLEMEVNEKIRRMILKFDDKGLSTTKINWLI